MASPMICAMSWPWIASEGGVRKRSPSSSRVGEVRPGRRRGDDGTPAGIVTFSTVGISSGVPQGPAMALTPSLSISLVAASCAACGSVLVSSVTRVRLRPVSPASAAAFTWAAARSAACEPGPAEVGQVAGQGHEHPDLQLSDVPSAAIVVAASCRDRPDAQGPHREERRHRAPSNHSRPFHIRSGPAGRKGGSLPPQNRLGQRVRAAIRRATGPDLAAALELRRRVFCEEQGVPEELERDAHDATALHLVADRALRGRGRDLPARCGAGAPMVLQRMAVERGRARPRAGRAAARRRPRRGGGRRGRARSSCTPRSRCATSTRAPATRPRARSSRRPASPHVVMRRAVP